MSGGAFTPVLAGLGVGVALASAPGPIQAVLLAETLRGGIPAGLRAQAGVNVVFAALLASLAFGLSVVVPGHLVLATAQAVGGALLILLGAEGLRAANRPPPRPTPQTSPPRTTVPTDAAHAANAASPTSAAGPAPGGPSPGAHADRATARPVSDEPAGEVSATARPATDHPAGNAPATARLATGAPAGEVLATAGAPGIGRWGWRLPGAARGALAVVLNPGTWLFMGAVATPLFGSALRRGGTPDALLVALVILAGCAIGDGSVVLIGGFGVRRAGQRGRQWVQRGLAVTLTGLGAWFLIAGTAALIRA